MRIVPLDKLKSQLEQTTSALRKLDEEKADLEAKLRENSRARAKLTGGKEEAIDPELYRAKQTYRGTQEPLVEWVIKELIKRKATTKQATASHIEVAKAIVASGYKSTAQYLHHVLLGNVKKGGGKWDEVKLVKHGRGNSGLYYTGKHEKE